MQVEAQGVLENFKKLWNDSVGDSYHKQTHSITTRKATETKIITYTTS